ncbi:hypothetical protein CAEBREN_01188 [Caenorhabditis brenneri]|uniref:VWFA domain-containing protein n=1 Tax=Caenorhabditis brenneri TaxID=135651 RepID=G0N204_CAEBE|nr:hypothetical protein CAEBREN_01188 [Caenorhabditis brenneri]
MLEKAVILLLLAITGANAVCTCYNPNLVQGTKVAVSNAFDNGDFSTCYSASCGFLAYSGDPAVGWNKINVRFASAADPTGKFDIYNGNSTSSVKIATYGVSDSATDVALYSSTPFIYVVYSQTSTSSPNAYYGFLYAGGGLSVPTTPAPTTVPPTTIPYSNPLYARDPQLISHDILVLVNQNYGQSNGLTALNDTISKFVNLLSVTTSTDSEKQSRLGLATIIPYAPYYSAQGEIWMMNSTDVIRALPAAGVTIAVNIIEALKNVVPSFFKVDNPTAATRKNVQRSVILFTSSWYDNAVLDDSVKKVFDDNGVNLAIIGYNTNSAQLSGNQWYNYAPLTNTTDSDVAGFVNRFYLNSDKINTYQNNWCKKSADPASTGSSVTEPSNYLGPPVSGATWTSSFDGQKGRYCNFQDTTYTYTRTDATKLVQITVYYELEVEQDYLKFFADGVEVESFTGIDVNNALFKLDATVITARFTSDSSGVRRGFYVKFDEVPR